MFFGLLTNYKSHNGVQILKWHLNQAYLKDVFLIAHINPRPPTEIVKNLIKAALQMKIIKKVNP